MHVAVNAMDCLHHRLRPEGLHVRAKIDAPTWFLNDRSDVRSSFYCEEAATEFDVQGLELDWAGVCWDADFRYGAGRWNFLKFRGTIWQRVNSVEGRNYLKNAYRVILTRSRQGMIIFVPQGAVEDATRPPGYYDETYQFLRNCGLRDLGQGKLDRWNFATVTDGCAKEVQTVNQKHPAVPSRRNAAAQALAPNSTRAPSH
jgi:hypothetical protein